MIKGVSKLIMPSTPMADFFKQAAEAGYQTVELVIGKKGELTVSVTPDGISNIKSLSAEYNLPIVSATHSHCTGNLLDSGDAQKTSVDETIKGLEIAKALGAKCTLHTMGRMNEDLYYDKAYENAIASLKMIAPEARRLGVKFAVEFVWSGFLFSPLEMKRFLDEVNDDYIGFYFDPGNMAVFQFPQHWARIVGKHIFMVHLKDWQGNALNGGWPALLKGDVNFAKVMEELRKIGYDDALISEVGPSVATLEETSKAIDEIMRM